ncbi:hypothetical protein [Streptomyces sp. NPDC029003]|uniref:hypothetical protein n=1 Tax=Streptomyces sp. NPDC029003 TaxID=3155125 RepID=UPI0033D040B0
MALHDDGTEALKAPRPASPSHPRRRRRLRRLMRRLLRQALLGGAGAVGTALITWLFTLLQAL